MCMSFFHDELLPLDVLPRYLEDKIDVDEYKFRMENTCSQTLLIATFLPFGHQVHRMVKCEVLKLL